MFLLKEADQEDYEDKKIIALLHGAKIKETAPVGGRSDLLFGDPKDYEKMTMEERKQLSDKMRRGLSRWAGVKKR